MLTHRLKCWPEYFQALESGDKKFELRKNDRPFGVGDKLILQEYNPNTGEYTGRCIDFTISYILRNAPEFGLHPEYCILSLSIKQ